MNTSSPTGPRLAAVGLMIFSAFSCRIPRVEPADFVLLEDMAPPSVPVDQGQLLVLGHAELPGQFWILVDSQLIGPLDRSSWLHVGVEAGKHEVQVAGDSHVVSRTHRVQAGERVWLLVGEDGRHDIVEIRAEVGEYLLETAHAVRMRAVPERIQEIEGAVSAARAGRAVLNPWVIALGLTVGLVALFPEAALWLAVNFSSR